MQKQIFVGRQGELAKLKDHLEQALSGHGQVCFITGEAGVGKTALVRQFVKQALAAEPDLVVAVGDCNAQTGIGDPYLPFREALSMLTGDGSAQPAPIKIAPENAIRLRTVLARSIQVLVEVAPELIGVFVPGAQLLGILGKAMATNAGWVDQLEHLAERPAPSATEQSHIFEQYTAFLLHLSAKTPLILFLDDLQWADGASLGLLFHLGRRIEACRILVLGAYRPNDVALGRGGERHPLEPVVYELARYYGDVAVDLDAIPELASRQFVDGLLDAEPNDLGETFRQALFHQTGGHALFTVELVQAMQERGDLVRDDQERWTEGPSLDWGALPARVEGAIAERIARLDNDLQELLTVASVEGETFAAEVVARVQAVPDREAIRHLSNGLQRQHRLVRDLGLIQFAPVRLSFYGFVHNLFQQYLYRSLDDAERTCLHRDTGQALEAFFGDQTEEMAEELAHHFEEAGLPAKAAAYRLQAGTKAHRMSAHQEAAAHLTRGLELLASLPQSDERMQLELSMQTYLGTTLIATHGYAAPQVERAFVRARELCRALGNPPQAIPVLFGLCLFHMVRAELELAYQEGEQLLFLAQQGGDTGYILGCLAQLGATAMYLGRFDDARVYLEQAIASYDQSQHHGLAYQHGQDPCVAALCYLSRVLWLQGYPEQAMAKQDAALKLARELNHLYSLGMAEAFTSTLYYLLRQWTECQTQAEATLRLSSQRHFPLWQAMGVVDHGTSVAYQDCAEQGIPEISQGLTGFEATGAQLALPYLHARLAEAYLLAGRQEEGLKALGESLASPEQGWWLPEQHRLRGELLLLAPGAEIEAEASLRQALEVAGRQKSRSLELRAATSLARLLRKQGRAAEGRGLLADCYAWFTEGFDTADLQEARELLDALRRAGERASTERNDQRNGGDEFLASALPGSLNRSTSPALETVQMPVTELRSVR